MSIGDPCGQSEVDRRDGVVEPSSAWVVASRAATTRIREPFGAWTVTLPPVPVAVTIAHESSSSTVTSSQSTIVRAAGVVADSGFRVEAAAVQAHESASRAVAPGP